MTTPPKACTCLEDNKPSQALCPVHGHTTPTSSEEMPYSCPCFKCGGNGGLLPNPEDDGPDAIGNRVPTSASEHKTWEDFKLAVEGSVKMLCAFSTHRDMAQTAQRAKEQGGFFEDELKRLFFLIEQALSHAKEEGQQEWHRMGFEDGKEVGLEEGRAAAQREIVEIIKASRTLEEKSGFGFAAREDAARTQAIVDILAAPAPEQPPKDI